MRRSVIVDMKPIQHANECPRGFTLIELLAVIAVIAILATFLFPTFINALSKAKSLQCANNLRQLYGMIGGYVADNNGRYPFPGRGQDAGKSAWDSDISPSKSINKTLLCPEDRIPLSWSGLRRTYSMNVKAMGITAYTATDPQDGKSVMSIQEPSKTLLLVELPSSNNCAYNDSCSCAYSPANQMANGLPPLHNGRFNYLFCDGHVEALLPKETIGTGTLSAPKGFWVLDSAGR